MAVKKLIWIQHFVLSKKKKPPGRSSQPEWWWWCKRSTCIKKYFIICNQAYLWKNANSFLTRRSSIPHRRFSRLIAQFSDRSIHLWYSIYPHASQSLTMLLFLLCLIKILTSYNDLFLWQTFSDLFSWWGIWTSDLLLSISSTSPIR